MLQHPDDIDMLILVSGIIIILFAVMTNLGGF